MTTIILPAYAFGPDFSELLERLVIEESENEITIDFLHVTFWTPGALVLLLAKTHHWLNKHKNVSFSNCKNSPASRYLQRINFFSECGIEMPEDFRRHDSSKRFTELCQVGGNGSASVEDLSTNIAYCLFPDGDVEDPEQSGLFDIIQYAVSELANNTIQHSRSQGFAMAQYTAQTDLIRVGIADTGIGILNSFSVTNSPLWTPELKDNDAMDLALKAKVSSKSHLTTPWGDSINAGVGLTLLKELSQNTGGSFSMASGNGILWQNNGGNVINRKELQSHFQGTVCALSFVRAKVKNFYTLLHEAKISVNLLPMEGKFGKYFE